MSQVPQQDKKKITLARVKRTEAYAEQVRVQFATTVNEILALYKTMPELDEGEMYSFDGENLKKQKEVERLLRQLHAAATVAIERGIKLEWAAANADCDKLFTSCFGKAVLSTPQFTADAARNNAAMQAFLARSDRGLNLSQRVWKSVEQLRDEMEVSMTVAIGEGESASSMSRKVRKYLNDPDLCFRRFRYKAGEEKIFDDEGNEIGTKPVYGKKWKKRVRKADGSVGWIDYDKDSYKDEWTGRGYYKSSAQNAMRVARTETNIAYRRADNERWQQLDFVLGQRIELSKQHPKKDICDKLAGDYPKDFIFDGWHPQCFCFVTPILMDESEMKKATEAFARGETYTPRGKVIRDYPEGFKSWVRDNAENIAAARERGTEPYFIRNNAQKIDEIIDPSKKQLTALERAAIRHENRTPEQEEAIKLRWQQRKENLASQSKIEKITDTANRVLSVVDSRFSGIDIDTTLLKEAIKSGNAETINAETRALAQLLSKKQQLIKKTASNVVNVAKQYKDLAGEPDLFALTTLTKSNDVSAINTQMKQLAQRIVAIKQKLNTFNSHLYNVEQWAKEFTVSELEAACNAVKSMYQKHSKESLSQLKDTLKFEAKWKQDHPKYSTDKVVKQAYEMRVQEIEEELKWQDIKRQHKDYLLKYATTFPTLTQELTDAITAKDLNAASSALSRLRQWDSIITQRSQMATALGSHLDMLKEVDAAIKNKNILEADNAIKRLAAWKDILLKRATIATNLGASNKALLDDLDKAIKNNDTTNAKTALDILERWSIVLKTLNKAKTEKQTDELKKLIKKLETQIQKKKIDDAEKTAAEIKKLTMSDLERYCEKHYTEKFTVHSQKTYDEVMTNMGKVSQPVWQAATREQKQAFVDYCGSYSEQMLTDIANGVQNDRVDRIDVVMNQIKYPHDIVLRSGQNFCMAEYIFSKEFRNLLENDMIDELNAKFAGTIGKNVAYMSTSFNKNGGFSKQFEFHLFCPQGTSMMNVYVLSRYGGHEGVNWDGFSYPKNWSSNGETEIFLGRGLLYKFVKAELGTGMGGTNRVYVQIVGTI